MAGGGGNYPCGSGLEENMPWTGIVKANFDIATPLKERAEWNSIKHKYQTVPKEDDDDGGEVDDGTGADPVPLTYGVEGPSYLKKIDSARKRSKKTKTNGYILFIQYRRKQMEEEKGEKLAGGLPEIMTMFDADWKKLPEEEKAVWKEKAKQRNERSSRSRSAPSDEYE